MDPRRLYPRPRSFLILSGSISDRLGRRRVFQIGLSIFTLASFLCSRAATINQLIAFRVLQGFGASMLNPVALSIIANAFPQPKDRARAVGIWGAVAGLSLGIGPLIGGALTETIGWRSIFWINVPIGITAIAPRRAFRARVESRPRPRLRPHRSGARRHRHSPRSPGVSSKARTLAGAPR